LFALDRSLHAVKDSSMAATKRQQVRRVTSKSELGFFIVNSSQGDKSPPGHIAA
jgi:hypothetical protein